MPVVLATQAGALAIQAEEDEDGLLEHKFEAKGGCDIRLSHEGEFGTILIKRIA
jgi:hypothetical protein